MNVARTDQRPTAPETAGRVVLWTGKWSIGRRIALFLFGLFMQFAHSMFFRMVLVPGYEWLGPIDPLIYLLAEVLAVATSFGLLALPFVKAPGRVLRAAVMTSLALGALANVAWMVRGFFLGAFSFYFTCDPRWGPCDEDILFSMLVDDVWSYALYGVALYLNLSFWRRISRHEGRVAVG